MYIVIVNGNKIIRLDSETITSSFNYQYIEISRKEDQLFLNNKKENKLIPLTCQKYVLKDEKLFNEISIYVYKDNTGIDDYDLYENKAFAWAANPKANIINQDPYLKDYYLIYKDGFLKTNADLLFLNNKPYKDEKLKKGDVVELLNFKFIYYDHFLYINHFLVINKMNEYKSNELLVEYHKPLVEKVNYYENYNNSLNFDKLVEFKSKPLNNQKKMILQIGPSITMSLATVLLAAINVYNNLNNDNSLLSSLVYIVMPITMILSGVMWPLINNYSEKKSNYKINQQLKVEYLHYLDDYEKKLNKQIVDYLAKENIYYFIDKNKLFYLHNKDEMFLKLSIGHIILNKDLPIKLSKDDEINKRLLALKNKVENIGNCPYFLDIKKYQVVSIIYSDISLIKRCIIELACKNHYEDFYLAIYSSNLNKYSAFYSLPQLIYNNKRLTLNKKSEVQELLSNKFNKSLILITDTSLDFSFSNKDVHLLSFCKKQKSLHKESEILIEYTKNGGLIYDKETISFSYFDPQINYAEKLKSIAVYQQVNFLKKTLGFKDIFKDLNIEKYYQQKQNSLKAKFAINGNETLAFDLHESKSGPHGLIAGATGSGKSELIVSLLLSLAIAYRPDYINIILIDYKGGGIEESLSYNGQRLPHIIATIDNLEADVFERLIVSIDFECKRRQRLFKELSNQSLTSIMNIDDYLEADYQKYNLPRIAHLLIVVDEFAEMKKENPQIIKELVSFSRIGRSLGVHLILATQRPSGVIDDEIWSNSHFKIALKVFNEKDSNDVIKHPNAAYLSNPGEFYLQVDESLIKAQSIYAKTDINNGEPYEVSLLDNRLTIIKRKRIKKQQVFSEASYLVGKIIEATSKLKINVEQLSFKKPPQKSREQLIQEYSYVNGLVLGEVDDYLNASKSLLKVDVDNDLFIFSTRNKEVNTILNHLNRPMVVIGSRRYHNQYISDSLKYEEQEDINYLLTKLLKEDYDISLIIEDLSALLSFDESLLGIIYQLLRRSAVKKLKLIVLSKQSIVNYKLLSCFKDKLAIKINDSQDLINIFSSRGEEKGDSFYWNDNLVGFVPIKEEEFIEGNSQIRPIVKCLPEKLPYVKREGIILLGFELISRKEVLLYPNEKLLLSSNDENKINYYQEIFKDDKNVEVVLYNRDLLKKDNQRIIWVGSGLYTQRLCNFDGKDELKENEAYYCNSNKGSVIRFISYE